MSAIKAGDLVIVVKPRPCGCPPVGLGSPHTVVATALDEWMCGSCGFITPRSLLVNCGAPRFWIHASRVKKIEPPDTRVEHREELTAC